LRNEARTWDGYRMDHNNHDPDDYDCNGGLIGGIITMIIFYVALSMILWSVF
jgi:hypothetical protein